MVSVKVILHHFFMKILIKKINLRHTLLKIGVTLSFLCVIYYSYLPFLYIVNALPIEKNTIFIGIVSISIGLAILNFMLFVKRINRTLMITISLYVMFSVYSLINFSLAPPHFDNNFTIIVLSVINPIFIILSFFCRNEKQYLMNLLHLASSLYILFAVFSYLNERLVLRTHEFQDIFGLTEKIPYQNINLYLGVSIVLTMVKAKYEDALLKKYCFYLSSLGAIGIMLIIGGRASLFATIIVVMIFFTIEYWHDSLFRKVIKLVFLLIISVLIIIGSHFILNTLRETITFWRILALLENGDSSTRFFLFSKAIDLFLLNEKNLLFGAGMNYFSTYIGATNHGMYPHNVILELLSEFGILGTLLFLSPIAYILFYRKLRLGNLYGRSLPEKLIFLMATYFWTVNMFTGGLRNSWVLIFFTYLLIPATQKNKDMRFIPHKT